jgi:hypothetical protein
MQITRIAAGFAVLSLAVGGTVPAHAATATSTHHRHAIAHRDVRHDIKRITVKRHISTVGHRSNGDVTTVSARYGQHFLWLRASFARLAPPSGDDFDSFEFLVSEPGGTMSTATIGTSLVGNAGKHGIAAYVRDGNTAPKNCPVAHTVNYAKARISIRVPYHCVREPWVRIGFSLDSYVGDDEFFDNGFDDGGYADYAEHLSARIYHP